MVRQLPVSAFAEAHVIPSYKAYDTPFGLSNSQDKIEWANRQLTQLYDNGDVLEIQVHLSGGPSIATYLAWLHRAMKETGESTKYRLQSKRKGSFLYVRKVERKANEKEGRVKHIIT